MVNDGKWYENPEIMLNLTVWTEIYGVAEILEYQLVLGLSYYTWWFHAGAGFRDLWGLFSFVTWSPICRCCFNHQKRNDSLAPSKRAFIALWRKASDSPICSGPWGSLDLWKSPVPIVRSPLYPVICHIPVTNSMHFALNRFTNIETCRFHSCPNPSFPWLVKAICLAAMIYDSKTIKHGNPTSTNSWFNHLSVSKIRFEHSSIKNRKFQTYCPKQNSHMGLSINGGTLYCWMVDFMENL